MTNLDRGCTRRDIRQAWVHRDDLNEVTDALRDLADYLDDLDFSGHVIDLSFNLDEDEGLSIGAYVEHPNLT